MSGQDVIFDVADKAGKLATGYLALRCNPMHRVLSYSTPGGV